MVDSLAPNDPRVEHKFAEVSGGLKYHYMLAKPAGKPTATILLCHGWPDLGMGWRNQVPLLLSLGLQVVVPDMLGYGETDAPDSYEEYTFKKVTSHLAELIKQVTPEPILLGGHDWGAVVAWRMTEYYPELIRGVFCVCVPYRPASPVRMSLPEMVKKLPNFKYQMHLAAGEAEEIVAKSPERLRAFLNGMYGGRTPEGKTMFSAEVGVIEENLDGIMQSPLMSKEMTDFYVQEYSRHGLHAPCNWYRTRLLNSDDEMEMAKESKYSSFKFSMPAMLLMADNDPALPAWMAVGQEQYFANGFTMATLKNCSHWALIEKPVEVNEYINTFLRGLLGDELKAAL